MDRFEAMSMLLMVVEKGSLSAASRALRVPVPTLSRRVSDLEALLGARLLIRTTRKISLTDAGEAYVAAARRIVEQVEEAERQAAGEFTLPKGELVLTAPILFGRLHVLPVVTAFLAQYPDINVRLQLSDRNAHLVEDSVDMAVRIGRLPDSSMVATQVGTMRTVFCASPALLAQYGEPHAAADLQRLPCILFDGLASNPVWRVRQAGASNPADIPITPRLLISTAEAAADAAIAHVGVTRLLHYQVVDAVEAGALQLILPHLELPPSPVNLVHASRGLMPLKMRRFLDFAVPRLRETLRRFEGPPL